MSLPYGFYHNSYALNVFPDPVKGPKLKNIPRTITDLLAAYFPDVDFEATDAENVMVSCPFHADDTPSMSVSVEKGVYKCHAACCRAQGTVVHFFHRMEGVPYAEAKKLLKHLNVGQEGYVEMALDFLLSRMEPMYTEGTKLVLRRRDESGGAQGAEGGLCEIPLGSWAKMEANLGRALDGAPCSMISEVIGDPVPISTMEKVVKEALFQMLNGTPDVAGLDRLGAGIHIREPEIPGKPSDIFMVDGRSLYRWGSAAQPEHDQDLEDVPSGSLTDPGDSPAVQVAKEISSRGWVEITEWPYANRYLSVGGPRDAWFPWHAEVDGSLCHPANLLSRLVKMLKHGWVWSNQHDPLMVALYTMYCPIFSAWDSPPIQVHVSGESQSGKSALAAGWFGGQISGTTPMVAGSIYVHDTTAAGLRQALNYRRQLVILDELLDMQGPRVEGVIEMMRGMETKSGARSLRGTTDGISKSWDISAPVVWSSINPGDKVQDVNRRLQIEFIRVTDPVPPDPWQAIRSAWTASEIQQTSRAVSQTLLPYIDELKVRTKALEGVVAKSSRGGYRLMMRILPLLAIADLCGLNPQKLIEKLEGKSAELEEILQSTSPLEDLRFRILTTRLYTGDIMGGSTNLISRIRQKIDIECMEYGIIYQANSGMVYLNPSGISKMLNGAISPVGLGRMLHKIPGYTGKRKTRSILKGSFVHFHAFIAEEMAGTLVV